MGNKVNLEILVAKQQAQKALEEFKSAAGGLGATLKNIRPDVTATGQSFSSMGTAASNSTASITSLLSSFIGFAAIAATIKSSVDAMNQLERATVGLAVTSRYAGAGMQAASDAAKSLAADGLMSAVNASQALQNLLSRGYTLEQSIQLMNRLKDSAAFNRQAHLEFGQAIVGATEGLKNENSILVDNAGVTKNVSVMWKEYALQIGKGADSLTQAEKRLAEYNGIMRETEGQIGNAARMTQTFQGAQARLNEQIFETKAVLGQALVPALTGLINTFKPAVGYIRDFVGGIAMMGASVGAFVSKYESLYDKGGLIGLVTNKGKREELKQEWALIDKSLEEHKQEIYNKFTGATLPDVGADSGKRRKDIITAGKKGKTASTGEYNSVVGEWNSLQQSAISIADMPEYQREMDALDFKFQGFMDKFLALSAKDKAEAARNGITAGSIDSLWSEMEKSIMDKKGWKDAEESDKAERESAQAAKQAAAKALQEQRTAAELDKQLKLASIETAQAEGVMTATEAQRQKLAVLREITVEQQTMLEGMKRGTAEENIAWNQQAEKVQRARLEVARLQSQLRLREPLEGLKQGLEDYADSAMNLGAQIQSATQNSLKSMEDSLVNFVQTGKLNFKDLTNSIIADMTRIAIRQSITGPLVSGLTSLVGAAFSGGGSSSGGGWSADGQTYTFHDGGLVSKFHSGGLIVPRFHFGGLASDEVPAVLQTGERVLDREHNALLEKFANKVESTGSVTVINNVTVNTDGTGDAKKDGQEIGTQVVQRLNTLMDTWAINQKRPGGLLSVV